MSDTPGNLHPCERCPFYQSSIWQPVDQRDGMAHLTRGFSRRDLAAGEILFEQDRDNTGVFCVSKGLIALRSHQADGSSTLLRLAYPGEIVGFRSFLGNGVHQTEARALLPSRVCTVGRMSAGRLLRDHPGILERLLGRSLAEIDRSHQRIIAASSLTNKDRLTALLIWLLERHGSREGKQMRMRLPMSRADLADLIGVQRETLSRIVRRVEDDGIFRFEGRMVYMSPPDPKAVAGTAC